MLSLANAAGFNAGLDEWFDSVQADVTIAFRGLAGYAFGFILLSTPQWYGTAVANWRIGINSPDTSFDPLVFRIPYRSREDAKQKGDYDAIEVARMINEGRLDNVFIGDTIYITNSLRSVSRTYGNDDGSHTSVHGEPYVQYLEDNRGGFLRPENEPGHMVEHAARSTEDNFPLLTSAAIRRLTAHAV